MNLRTLEVFRLCFVFLLPVFLFAGCEGGIQSSEDLTAEKPNIIYILADDMGYGDLGSYGQELIRTPNLDRMSEEGMRFTQHYSGSTVCAPSRSVLMTGFHSGHTMIRGNREHLPIGQEPLPYSIITVADVLHEAGYATGAFGKWGLGYPESEGMPSKQGFDEFFGYLDQRRAHFYYPEFLFHDQLGQPLQRVILDGNEVDDDPERHPGSGPPISRAIYGPDRIQEEALSFIDENNDRPFFLYLPVVMPHASLSVPDETLAEYLNENGESIFMEEPFPGNHYSPQPMPRAAYAAMITHLDNYVGQILDKLDEFGIAENTLVIFSSDNGSHQEGGHDPDFFASNGPFRGNKRDLYEGGIRVPMIARWTGQIEAGSTSDLISSFQDIMPTFSELAGAPPPPGVDGISMVPTLLGEPGQEEHDYLYWEFHEQGGKQAVRMDDWKAVRLGVIENRESPIELYDLNTDESEENNVADQHPDIVEEMNRIIRQAHIPSQLFPLFDDE